MFQFSEEHQREWVETLDWLRRLQTAPSTDYDGFWPTSRGELEQHLLGAGEREVVASAPRPTGLPEPIPAAVDEVARRAAQIEVDLEDSHDFQGLFLGGGHSEVPVAHRQVFDAKCRNLVVMDNSGALDDFDGCDLLGDWEREVCVGYVRDRLFKEGATAQQRNRVEPEHLELFVCEPWAVDDSGEPLYPYWVKRDLAKAQGVTLGSSWKDVRGLPWKEVKALPLNTYSKFYEQDFNNRSARTRQADFMGTGLPAVVGLHLQDANFRRPALIQRQPFGQLHYVCTVGSKKERENGTCLPEEAMSRIDLSLERVRLKKRLQPELNKDLPFNASS